MDILTPAQRSVLMSSIRGKDTKPELTVRRIAHALGYRFRVHRRDLPGNPDVVFPRLRKIVFVHGCYWHRHASCQYAYVPKSNTAFWKQKFDANVARDKHSVAELEKISWEVLIIWECETRDEGKLACRLAAFLKTRRTQEAT